MQVSAEIRYFWRNAPPNGIEEWFCRDKHHPFPAGGGESRVDVYLRDSNQTELGVKSRGNKPGVEVKGLVGFGEESLSPPFEGKVEIWTKWSSQSLELGSAPVISIDKARWLRKFDASQTTLQEVQLGSEDAAEGQVIAGGCLAELTKLRLANADVWWTFGLEAFGTVWAVRENLRRAAEALAVRRPPALAPEVIASYPFWMSKYGH